MHDISHPMLRLITVQPNVHPNVTKDYRILLVTEAFTDH